jgi:hypothetical protein
MKNLLIVTIVGLLMFLTSCTGEIKYSGKIIIDTIDTDCLNGGQCWESDGNIGAGVAVTLSVNESTTVGTEKRIHQEYTFTDGGFVYVHKCSNFIPQNPGNKIAVEVIIDNESVYTQSYTTPAEWGTTVSKTFICVDYEAE